MGATASRPDMLKSDSRPIHVCFSRTWDEMGKGKSPNRRLHALLASHGLPVRPINRQIGGLHLLAMKEVIQVVPVGRKTCKEHPPARRLPARRISMRIMHSIFLRAFHLLPLCGHLFASFFINCERVVGSQGSPELVTLEVYVPHHSSCALLPWGTGIELGCGAGEKRAPPRCAGS